MGWISAIMERRTFRIWAVVGIVGAIAMATALFISVQAAEATHGLSTLAGSNFEIDNNANLKVDHQSMDDWASVNEVRNDDAPTGRNDDSYAGGAKEDDTCPGTTTGSIPNNKSDLLTFGAYVEEEENGSGFLNLFWTRVQEPSGTTLMDFELNKSSTDCGNGVNPVRTEGDLLIEYRIEQGGAVATIKIREWTGSAWGPAQDLTAIGAATGTINSTAIPAGEADGLGALSARTFGEAQLDLDFIFDEGSCESFGSAFLKSRASDSFTSQLKDFIAPVPVQISNCGSVKVEKVDDAGNPLAGATFQLFEDNAPAGGAAPGPEDLDANGDLIPAKDADGNNFTCTTDATGFCTISNVFFGNYWLDETVVPAGHSKPNDLPMAITIDGTETVTFGPFVNQRDRGSILVAKVDGSGNPLAGAQFALDGDGDPGTTGDQTPIPEVQGQTGLFCVDNLLFGQYHVVETQVPDGYTPETVVQSFNVSSASTCAERTGDPVDSPDLTFRNIRNPGAIVITKTAKDFNDPSGSSPLAGVDFTVTNSEGIEVAGSPVTTGANGEACIGGLTVGQTYTVTESGVPAGFLVDNSVTEDVLITDDADCDQNRAAADTAGPFSNDPLSEITVTFSSLSQNGDGEDRTAATIDCQDQTAEPEDTTPLAFDDSSETFTDLEEGTYTCTVVIDP